MTDKFGNSNQMAMEKSFLTAAAATVVFKCYKYKDEKEFIFFIQCDYTPDIIIMNSMIASVMVVVVTDSPWPSSVTHIYH